VVVFGEKFVGVVRAGVLLTYERCYDTHQADHRHEGASLDVLLFAFSFCPQDCSTGVASPLALSLFICAYT
jgi:hypothetical protein